MFKRIFVGLALCCSVMYLSTGIAAAKGKDKNLGDKILKKMHIALEKKEELGLSDAQFDEILALKVKTKKDCIMKKAEIETILLDVKAELMRDRVDIDKVNTLIDKKYNLKNNKTKTLIQSYVDLKDILTENQMDDLKEIYESKKHYKYGYGNYGKKGKGYMFHTEEGEHMMKREHMRGMYE